MRATCTPASHQQPKMASASEIEKAFEPVCWRRAGEYGYVWTSMPRVAEIWRDQQCIVEPLYSQSTISTLLSLARVGEEKEAEVKRLRAALYEIATTDEYRGLTAEEAMEVAQKALSPATVRALTSDGGEE